MIKKYYEPIYRCTVYYCYGDFDCLRAGFKKYSFGEEDFKSLAGGVTFLDTADKKGHSFRDYLVWVEPKPRSDFYTLSHECIHLANNILHDRGIPVTKENDEATAYLHTYWLRKFWNDTPHEGEGLAGSKEKTD